MSKYDFPTKFECDILTRQVSPWHGSYHILHLNDSTWFLMKTYKVFALTVLLQLREPHSIFLTGSVARLSH